MKFSLQKGFTLLELMVSLAIFAFMTAFLLAKYGNFNQSVLVTDLAYDTAVTIRNAQAAALNVQGVETSGPVVFIYAYGVHFAAGTNSFIYFYNTATSPAQPSLKYTSGTSQVVSTYTMKAGDSISAICVGALPCASGNIASAVDVAFQRPNPDAKITATIGGVSTSNEPYVDVTILASDGETKNIDIQSTGEISVTN